VRLDPQVEEAFRPLDLDPPIWELPVPEARRRERSTHAALNPPARRSIGVATVEVDGPGGRISCELLIPPGGDGAEGPHVIYFHGGGCVLLDPEAYRPVTSAIAEDAKCTVIVPRYRLAPEHPFPAAVEDAIAVYRWAIRDGDGLGADPARLALCGDSAGGCLSAAVTLDCARSGIPQPAFQALVYPCTDVARDWPSYHLDGVADTLREVEWLTEMYAGGHESDPLASPLRASSHRGLPPAFILAAEVDPLLDQGRAYAEALSASGVPIAHVAYSSLPHGFLSMSGKVDAAALALSQLAEVLRSRLHS
jgi:acetyl esterase